MNGFQELFEWTKESWNYEVGDFTVGQFVLAFLFLLCGFVARTLILFILRRLDKFAERTRTSIDNILFRSIDKPLGWGAILAGVYFATRLFTLPVEPFDFPRFIDAFARGLSILLLIWLAIRLVNQITERWMEKARTTDSKLDDLIIPIVRSTSRVFLVLIGIVFFLQNIGYSVGSLLAGVGIGGAAIAFASKDLLANLFGSVVIFFDRPFQIGDWVVVGDVEGTIETVGLRTTRVRTFANALVTVPNSDFTTKPIINWSAMKKRRIKTHVTLSYDTTPEQMEQALAAIRGLIDGSDDFRHDFYLVHFTDMAACSLDILIYCFTVTTKWAEWMAIREKFYLDIMKKMNEIGVEFAFPTQTVHVGSLPRDVPPDGDLP